MGQGRYRRAALHEGRCPGARRAELHAPGLDLLAEHKDIHLDLASIPAEDPRTYAMIRKADTLGTPSRSRAGRRCRCCRSETPDLLRPGGAGRVMIWPGPIQGDMVHPYLRRRGSLEEVDYPGPSWRRCWEEDARRAAVPGTGDARRHRMRGLCTAGEADLLRKSMATFKHTGGVSKFRSQPDLGDDRARL